METITLAFNPNDTVAMAVIGMIERIGHFDIMREDNPNETTLQALHDAHSGNTHKCQSLDDLFSYLKS